MVWPCILGLKCPYFRMSEDCLPICTYPRIPDQIAEDDETTYGIVDEGDDCELVEYGSDLYNLIFAFENSDVVQDTVTKENEKIRAEACATF